jgi:ABC-2 type transport system ATP-binding protein
MSPTLPLAIETHALTHRFGTHHAVRGLDLAVPQGAVYGFLGPNGSGKTTSIRLLLGLLRPQSGTIRILGQAMPDKRLSIARHVGSMVETPSLYDHLSGFDNLELTRRALGAPLADTGRVLSLVDLAPQAGQRVGTYSLGMRQRLGIARALLGRPRLLILDEPTNGLDPAGVADMRRLIRALPEAEGVTVFVSSHLLGEVEQMATHVGLMHAGRLIAQSSLSELLASTGRTIDIRVERGAHALECLRAAGIDATLEGVDRLTVPATGSVTPQALNRLLVDAGFDVWALSVHIPTLEDIFLDRTLAAA